MKKLYTISLLLCMQLCIFSLSTNAQEDESAPKSEAEIAKELSNPNTTLGTMAFPIDYIHYNGDLPGASSQNGFLLNFQPSLPIPLSEGVNLFVRPLIPIYLSQPVFGDNGFENKGVNLGNISADVAVGKTWPSKTITIVGVFGGFPTATNKQLRSKFTTVGPEFMVAQMFNWGVLGVMFNHAWSVNSYTPEDDVVLAATPDQYWISTANKQTASVTAGQYFYVVNLKNAWQITGQPTFAYNHKAEKGSRFTFPVGTGVNKVTRFGKLPVKLSVQYWYYLARPDAFGPQHQVRVQIAPVIPLPW
ncbi:hypothetical protein OU798_06370 [Prolixibacteraceae bacterium Z1-6]|uniref:Neuromedin U n=1 Tax=Draconibacterium aestuarii TaxID=2998507 RepID=A0A9X3FBP7_9BACT|nr:hypothetical protein [Prolixibacteraceae bacterium Z1-6]